MRRKAKQAAKDAPPAVGLRSSARLQGREVEREALRQIIQEEEKNSTGSGCIPVMLAHNYDPDKHDVTGWLMSEKLDGVRCYWNGKNMYTRNGNPFYAPDDWKAKLPNIALDGELWTNRDDFQKIVSIVRK